MRTVATLLSLALAGLGACSADAPGTLGQGQPGGSGEPGGGKGTLRPEGAPRTVLDDRVVDYNEALRTASLKLVRGLPTLVQIKRVASATDPKAAYEAELDVMLADPRFRERMIKWWKDVMRQGGAAGDGTPSRDTAPVFAARVLVEGRSLGELFTATTNTCPSYDYDAHAFVDGDCDNGVPTHAGVLTNPGVMYQFYSSMAFRRVRWVQEIFVCTKFPAEYSEKPVSMGGADYVSPWPFESVGTAPIDFQDTSSVICANCHTTMNHLAPLFGRFDAAGNFADAFQVTTPVVPQAVTTEIEHWLKPGEVTSWRLGEEAADLPALGKAIAGDPAVAECATARLWNYTMSKEDVVTDLSTVPTEVIQPYIDLLAKNGGDLKKTLRAMFASEDFVSF